MNKRKNWSKEETILAFDLYCKIPFGQIDMKNPDIIALANLIGRSPGSVSLKMGNLASYDPELKKRGVKGMEHSGKLGKEVFDEFYENMEELGYQADKIRTHFLYKENVGIAECFDPNKVTDEVILAGIKHHRGQFYFKKVVLNSYGNKCCITGISIPELLVASHIKPWNVSNEKNERTNPKNGLCLNSLHSDAFKKGLFTLNYDYEIIISSKLNDFEMDDNTKKWLTSYDKKEIAMPDKFYPDKKFLEYHNDVVFVP